MNVKDLSNQAGSRVGARGIHLSIGGAHPKARLLLTTSVSLPVQRSVIGARTLSGDSRGGVLFRRQDARVTILTTRYTWSR